MQIFINILDFWVFLFEKAKGLVSNSNYHYYCVAHSLLFISENLGEKKSHLVNEESKLPVSNFLVTRACALNATVTHLIIIISLKYNIENE